MPPGIASLDSVPLRECRCGNCSTIFYICQRCYRGQCYCSASCRDQTRILQRRRASRLFQQSDAGRQAHRDYQRAYRERLRARSAIPVTDQSSNSPDSESSSGCDASRPSPHSPSQPLPRQAPPLQRLPPLVLRCRFCGRPGYLLKPDLYVPHYPAK